MTEINELQKETKEINNEEEKKKYLNVKILEARVKKKNQ